MDQLTAEELESNLAHFTGTESYTKIKYPWANLLLTDGTKYLCEKAKCFWLMDLIASYQPKKLNQYDFQHWVINASDNKAVVTCDDGNEHILVEQHIGWTDFPLREVGMYAQLTDYPEHGLVVMLTSEY